MITDLEAAGLGHEVVESVHDEQVPADHVVRVAEDLGDQAPEGTTIPLVVSLGPELRVVPTPADGAGFTEVAKSLGDIRLEAVRAEDFSDTVPAGQVIGLDPPSGTEVERDSQVRVIVSKGPELVAVPDVRGQTLEQAEAALEARGLRLGQVLGSPRGQVVFTEPPPGQQVRKGTEVNVLTSR